MFFMCIDNKFYLYCDLSYSNNVQGTVFKFTDTEIFVSLLLHIWAVTTICLLNWAEEFQYILYNVVFDKYNEKT